MGTATKDKLDTWRESNPVRRWRATNVYGLHNAATVLGVSVSSLQTLESGKKPTDEMLDRIWKQMGYASKRLARVAFDRWFAKRPK